MKNMVFEANRLYWGIPACFLIFMSCTFIPYMLSRRANAGKFISRRWIMVAAWFCLLLLCIIIDGHFLESGLVQTIGYCSAGLACIYMLSSTFENISFKKGDFEVRAIREQGTKEGMRESTKARRLKNERSDVASGGE